MMSKQEEAKAVKAAAPKKKKANTEAAIAQVSRVKVTLTRSLIGRPETQRRVARALGFSKTSQTVEHVASPVILGMVNAISHLVSVEQVG
jgi:large subunit ribosomal protein L30